MARRLLTATPLGAARAFSTLTLLLVSGVELEACRRHTAPQSEPVPAVSGAAAAARSFADAARANHFTAEMRRAEERWAAKPNVEDCSKVLHEDGDAALCESAASGLVAIEQLKPDAATADALQVLADGSATLARLSQRARYQALAELSQRRTTGTGASDSGASDADTPARATPTFRKRDPSPDKPEQHALELTDSPATRFMSVALRLERDSLRNLGAYLEYAPLPARRSAFEVVKKLRETRPQWPLLEHLMREASLLESDPDLKRALTEFSASGLPRSRRLQATDSK